MGAGHGDLDLIVGNNTTATKLFRNDLNDTHYLKVKVTGRGSGFSVKDGTGARVELWDAASSTLYAIREITGGQGFGSHGPRIAHFGLASSWGGGSGTYTVKVKFIGGTVITRSGVVPASSSITIGGTTLPQTIRVDEGEIIFANPTTQVVNQLAVASGTTPTDVELVGFQVSTPVSTVTLSQVVANLTYNAIVDADVNNFRLYTDLGTVGTFESGTDTLVATVAGNPTTGTVTFGSLSESIGTAATHYIVIYDAVNAFSDNDQISASIGTADITTTASSKVGDLTSEPTHTVLGQGGVATWAEVEDIPLTGLEKLTTKRVRIEISNEGANPSGSVLYRLEVSQADPSTCGAATYTRVDTSTHWNMVATTYFADADPTANVTPGLTDGNTTFVAGELKKDGAGIDDQTSAIVLSTTEFTEMEYAIQATASATDGATYCFRLTDAGSAADFTHPETRYAKVTLANMSAAISSTNPASLTEGNLDAATVTVTLTDGTYNGSLVTGDFSLNGAPTGTSISGVVRDSATRAILTLAFDGTDFDSDANMSVTVATTALVTGGPLTTGTVTVTAVVEGALNLQQLHYRWRNDDGGEAVVAGSVDSRISQSTDDQEEGATGTMESITSTDLEMVEESNTQIVGLRFQNVTIPAGATITFADIEFVADEADTVATSLTLEGQLDINPATFTTTAFDISGRTNRTSAVAWNGLPAWAIDDKHKTPDIKDIIQEIVNQAGWGSSNQSLVIIVSGPTLAKRVAKSYDGVPAEAPLLHVDYTNGSVGATWAAAEDTPLNALSTLTTQRLRMEISNEGTVASGSVDYRLEVSDPNPVSCDDGGHNWFRIDTSTHWNMVASPNFADGDSTYNIGPADLTDENTTFVNGELKESTDQISSGITLSTTEFTEIEYAIQATASATDGATYCFRLTDAGTATSFNYFEANYGKVRLAGADLEQIHYRWRNDDGGEGAAFDTGDGTDGALTPTGTFNLNTDTSGGRSFADGIAYRVVAPADAASSVTRFSGSDTLSNGIAAGDAVLLIHMQGAAGDVADRGNYEFLEVQSVSATTITFTASTTQSYDGTTASNQKVVVQRVPNYTSVTLDSTDSLTASGWDGLVTTPTGAAGYLTGIVVFKATGTVDVGATASIDVDGLGYAGSAGGSTGGGSGISFVSSGGVTGTTTGASFSFDIGTAGTDRLVVLIADDESAGNNLTAATVDGKSCFTNQVAIANNVDGLGNHQEMYYCDEDDLGASFGSVTVAVTAAGGTGWGLHAHLYTGVDQGGPTDWGIDQTSAGTTTQHIQVPGIDVPANGLVVMGAANGNGGYTTTWTSPLTERTSGPDPSSADLMTASAVETSAQTNKTYIADYGAVTMNRGTGIVGVWPEAISVGAGGTNGESYEGTVGSGGYDTVSGGTGGNPGTDGGGGSSNYDGVSPEGTRAGGGYGDGGGGGGGGADTAVLGGSGGSGGTTGLNAGGGGGEGGDNAVGGAGGDDGSSGGGTGNEGAAGSLLTKTGQGGGTFPGCGGCGGVGAGGGGGHDNGPVSGGNGGDGGGIIFIMADSVTVSGSMTSIGTAGVAAASREGAGGGGSGGSILIQANSATLGTSNVQATGGAGGARSATPGAGGGGGGIGRIRVEAAITGTTNPTASTSGAPGGGGATWTTANEDTALTGLTKHTVKRLRIEVSNGGELASGSVPYRLEVSQANPASCNDVGNTWTRVDTSTEWNMMASTHFADGDPTSNVSPGLTDGNTTFVPGQLKESSDETTGITLNTTDFTEIEYALAATNSATGGATYCFRLTDAGNASGFTYTETKYGKVRLGADLLFGFRKPITIDRSKLSDPSCAATLTNFPILYKVIDLDLRSTANGGNVTDSAGTDIIFRASDLSGLDHEIEKYDPTTGELIAWVRIPSLNTNAAASDTVIYIYYGNSDVATSTENVSAVWDVNYTGVWHLDESPANGVAGHDDSNGNPNDGTPQNFWGVAGSTTDATGHIGGADEFDGTNDYVDLGNLQSLAGSSGMTTSFWFNAQTLPSVSGENDGLVIQHDTFDEQFGCRFDGGGSSFQCYVETGAVVANVSIPYSGNIIADTPYHVALTFNSGVVEVFLDGVSKGTNDKSGSFTTLPDLTNNMLIGVLDLTPSDDEFDGVIDEVRISDTARNACFIDGQFNNQDAPGDIGSPGFYTVGTEDPSPLTFAGCDHLHG